MSALLRRFTSRLAVTAFVAGLLLPLLPATHVLWDDDRECGGGGVGLAHSPLQFEAATRPGNPTHCPACHLLRAVAGADLTVAMAPVESATTLEMRVPPRVTWHGRIVSLEGPSRAPPAIGIA